MLMIKITTTLLLLFTAHMSWSQCFQDRHSTVSEDGWVSCSETQGPKPERSVSHWLMYDFGEKYVLHGSHFWNLNAPDRTNEGIASAVVDFSTDGVNWTEWGTFNLDEAPASGFYEGQEGPNFGGITAQYVLITVLSTHGGSCAGLSELKIETSGISTSTEDIEIVDNELTLFPNPADQFAELKFESKTNYLGQLQITDLSGKVISENQIRIKKGKFSHRINTSNLLNGDYIITLSDGEENKTEILSVIHNN